MKISKFFYFVAFFILVLLMHPLYMEQSVYEWLYKSGWKNEIAKIEINNLDSHNINITNKNGIMISYPNECKKKSAESCVSVRFPLSREWKKYNVQFEAIGNGKNQILFMAPQEWKKETGNIPVLVDYKDIRVNGKKINIKEMSLWFDYPYGSPVYDVKDGQSISLSFSARQHHIKLDDIKLINHTYSGWKISSIWLLIGTIMAIIYSLMLIHLRHFKHLFCFIVFVFLSLPFIFISQKDISEQENRSLHKFPVLFADGKVNERFGLDFDGWFSDRFGGRKLFIDSRFLILYRINNKIANEKAFMGDDGWLFPTVGIKKLSSVEEQHKDIIEIAYMLKKVDNYMKGKDVQLYVILEPSRSLLYKKYWENFYPYIDHIDYNKELKAELKNRKNIHLLDLKEVFEKNKDKIQLYEKNDSHMTLPAVNLMIEEVVSALGDDVKNHYEEFVRYKDRDCRLFDYSKIYEDYLEIYSEEKNDTCREITMASNNMKTVEEEVGWQEAEVLNPYINKDLYIMSLCYGEFMYPVLGEFFAHTISVNYNAIEKHDEKALKNKALSKLKSIKPGSIVIIFLSYPTENEISRSTMYLEAF